MTVRSTKIKQQDIKVINCITTDCSTATLNSKFSYYYTDLFKSLLNFHDFAPVIIP